ncbi:hypothetical protein C1645_878821 [Glomus cerebriforme]|uniref:MIR domain-containing protein n=1 Tax=Glomus cerebriforme TaxID=658196 RepID=A0A397SU33_9GLOM|nr:hypothetical protein C1645_878821 [Glomus cerebriforme]
MELPKYSGTVHPEEWLKQVQTFCYFKSITNEQEILKICKLMIDSTIIIPNEINSFNELIKTLKSHATFNIFKDSCKRKLQVMKYIPEQEENYTATFLANFRSLCNNAEINNPEEIKSFLFNTYSSNEFFENEFIKRIDIINSKDQKLDDINDINIIVNLFNDVVFDELNAIKYDSLITLKHVTTGRYLSSCNINYQEGSYGNVVFAGEKLCNSHALWLLTKVNSCPLKKPYQQNMVFYNDKFYLKHKETNATFVLSYYDKSPTTGQSKAICYSKAYSNSKCQFVNLKSKNNNNTLHVKSKDIINLKTINEKILFLRSHDFTFTIDDKKFQEVVGHADRIGTNDEWQIELV